MPKKKCAKKRLLNPHKYCFAALFYDYCGNDCHAWNGNFTKQCAKIQDAFVEMIGPAWKWIISIGALI